MSDAPSVSDVTDGRRSIALTISAALTIVGLALMVWSILAPTPLPVMLAMTVGQVVGTAAFAIYLVIVIRDLRRKLNV